jgi:dihydrolipoamide dehydrogenase
MVVGEMADAVDLLVLGGGPGGYAAALHAAALGRDVVLVDRDGVEGLGGTCVRVGCIPSKALIELANLTSAASHAGPTGLTVTGLSVDLAAFQTWKSGVVGGLNRGLQTLFTKRGIEVVTGVATFNRPNQVVVATPDDTARFLEFRDVVVATGSRAAELAGFPHDGDRILDSTDALALTTLPASIVVVGTGYVGIELGTAFAKLGTAVTLVETCDRILPQVDAAVSAPVQRACANLGIEVLTSAEVVDLDDDSVLVAVRGEQRRVRADKVIVAIGRRPATADIGPAAAGMTLTGTGHVVTDEFSMAAQHVAAIGDISAGPALAHRAMAQAEAAVRTLSGTPTRFEPLAIPAVVFSEPEIALVGLSEGEARADGMDVVIGQFPLAASGRAATLRSQRGFGRVVIDRGADAIVGVQLVGPHVSELLGEAGLAIEMGASPEDLASVIHPHPTISEALGEAAAVAVGRPLHVLRG